IPYTNVLHAHSHLAILGWAFLGTFIIFLSIQWDYNKRKKEAKAISVTLFITSLVMFIAFLYQGYGLVSIILSTLHIFVEYWTASFIFRHLKMGSFRSQISNLFIKGSFFSLLLLSLVTFFFTSIVMFIAFLYQGYGLVSIILSTLHIFVEYWTASFIFRHLKMGAFRSQISNLFIKGSLVALLLSSLGPFALGYISSTGMKESAFFDMAIYFYLHFQYNGLLYLFLIGLLITILHYKKIHYQLPC